MVKVQKQLDALDETDLVHQLYSNTFSGLVITAIAYFAVVYIAAGTAPVILTDFLKYSMALLLSIRLIDYIVWRTSDVSATSLTARKTRFKVMTIITGFLWAVAACSLHQFQSIELKYFTLLTLGSMTGGSVNVLSGSRLLATVYPSLLILPLSIISIFSDVQSIHTVGLLGSAYWFIMFNVSRRSARTTREMIRIKNEQIALRSLVESERVSLQNAYDELNLTKDKLHQANNHLESKVRQRTAEIYRLSNLDPLTGLLNRTAFTEELEQQIAQHKSIPLSIIFVDLSGFKSINDSLGHQIGDMVLGEIGKRLKQLQTAKAVCRWGGDEFVLFSQYRNQDMTLEFTSQIASTIAQVMHFEDLQVEVAASLGVSLYPENERLPKRLIEQADLAMYTNKKDGSKQAVFYTDALRVSVQQQQKYLDGLKYGLQNKEFFLLYQPIVHSTDAKPWGVEALLRWQFGDELIGPDDFIPLAERTGVINEIGIWVLEQACEQAMKWQYAENAHLSVNVSVVQLQQHDFFDSVKKALDQSKLPPERLHLEITETLLFEVSTEVLASLDMLRDLGVGVSIDDFGTGYSSLSKIQQLPTDCIKIDRAFVAELDNQVDVIIRAALLVSQEYHFATVAEGVENKKQFETLERLGVALLQGFYFSKPIDADALDKWWAVQNST